METATVHALEHDHMPAGIDDRTRDRDPGPVGQVDGGRHDLFRALMREALVLGDIHRRKAGLRKLRRLCASATPPSRTNQYLILAPFDRSWGCTSLSAQGSIRRVCRVAATVSFDPELT
jgi:hypothetical protein